MKSVLLQRPCRRRNTGIARPKASSRTKSRNLVPPKCAPSPNKSSTVACSNFAFAAELDGAKPPEACDKRRPGPRENQERTADLPARFLCRHPQIAERHRRKKYV